MALLKSSVADRNLLQDTEARCSSGFEPGTTQLCTLASAKFVIGIIGPCHRLRHPPNSTRKAEFTSKRSERGETANVPESTTMNRRSTQDYTRLIKSRNTSKLVLMECVKDAVSQLHSRAKQVNRISTLITSINLVKVSRALLTLLSLSVRTAIIEPNTEKTGQNTIRNS